MFDAGMKWLNNRSKEYQARWDMIDSMFEHAPLRSEFVLIGSTSANEHIFNEVISNKFDLCMLIEFCNNTC